MAKKRILVAPLNWGLGHATRCIPIITELQNQDLQPVIASDGAALELLKKEFPALEFYRLPSYGIKYSKSRHFFRIKLLLKAPSILRTISAEKRITEKLVMEKNISGIISDNRWGVRSSLVPSVFITHQVNVLAGFLTNLSSRIHHKYIKHFDECWVPDVPEEPSLSGRMGHTLNQDLKIRYLEILSRFQKQPISAEYDIAIIISGPEPQREMLENILTEQFRDHKAEILLVKGMVQEDQYCEKKGNITTCNFLTSVELEKKINNSKVIICRCGYTSILDLAALEKKVFFIPTPGQPEQEYLAKKLEREKLAPFCNQDAFTIGELDKLKDFKGLTGFCSFNSLGSAFTLFHGK